MSLTRQYPLLLLLLIGFIVFAWALAVEGSEFGRYQNRPVHSSLSVNLPDTWDILAPFPIGTREFGADPLEAFGGIREIHKNRSKQQKFPSELVFGGYVSWTSAVGGNNPVNIQWNSSIVDWSLIEGWGGLTSSQFQGWAVGRVSVKDKGSYSVRCTGISTFYIENERLIGDVYGLGYGTNTISLSTPGDVWMFVPLSGMENAEFQCGFEDVDMVNGPPLVEVQDHMIPDLVTFQGENTVAGGWFGLSVTNRVLNAAKSFSVSSSQFQIVQQPTLQQIHSHQTGIINFQVDLTQVTGSAYCKDGATASNATFAIKYQVLQKYYVLMISVPLSCRTWGLPYAFTFLDFDRSVQYAAARPPVIRCSNRGACPVLFTFHGAGVEARKDAWVYAYKQQTSVWLLFPTNRRQFGFDWEGPGKTNAWYAMSALESLPGVPKSLKSQYQIDSRKIQYAGHSMGGHGCWYISTHAPDRALSVSPAAGWIKMGMYIPFFTRVGDSLVDPYLQQILMSAISMHNTDFYMRNLKGIPLMVRMGALDDNVPPYHLKRMARIHNQLAQDSTATVISEIPGESHWWGGVVDDAAMQDFFNLYANTTGPHLPQSFTVSFTSPADFESKGGIQPIQTILYGRAAYIKVVETKKGVHWTLTTSNVRSFTFLRDFPTMPPPESITLDGQYLKLRLESDYIICLIEGVWKYCSKNEPIQLHQKDRYMIGPIPRILENELAIIYPTGCGGFGCDSDFLNYAISLANTLYYQGRYTPKVISDQEYIHMVEKTENVIILGNNFINAYLDWLLSNPKGGTFKSPVTFSQPPNAKPEFTIGNRLFSHPSSAVAYVVPANHGDRYLALIVAGNTVEATKKATSLIPTKSSWTLPDWAVTGPEYGWNGAAGLLGAGYWSYQWDYEAQTSWMSNFDEF